MYISVDGISFSYERKEVLDRVSFSLGKGEVVSLLGPNGSGKTTLLKVILGILKPVRGRVLFEGVPIHTLDARSFARKVAYVPQEHACAFAFSVRDVVLMGRMPHKTFLARYSRQDREIADAALEKLGIIHLRDKAYTRISGGERQLVLIGRAMAQGARTFVMDEPITGLDYGNQIKLLELIMSLAAEGHTFIKSTHFPDHAMWISDHVVLMKEGRVAAEGGADRELTADSLADLYNIPVRVMDAGCGFTVCVPGSKKWECMCNGRKHGHHGHAQACCDGRRR